MSNNITSMRITPIFLYVRSGKWNYDLTAHVTPADYANCVEWSCDDPSIATIHKTTGAIFGIKPGTATITATAKDGSGITATCDLTVTTSSPTWFHHADRIIRVANEFMGKSGSEINETALEKFNYTCNSDFGVGPWCDRFVNMCLDIAGVFGRDVTYTSVGSTSMKNFYADRCVYHEGTQGIRKGDIAFFQYTDVTDGSARHVAFATSGVGEDNRVHTLNGNWGDKVKTQPMPYTKNGRTDTIIGYARPDYQQFNNLD